MKKTILFFLLIFSIKSFPQSYVPSQENLEARRWFSDAKFGLFIHWGVYSILGDGEWVMNNQNISIEEYEKLPSFFNPIDYNPSEWVKMAKDAGMKYITITSRHHDGFSMFDSKITDYDIIDSSPYKRDILKMLAEECKKEGIKLFFYYSLLDWHNDDYFPRGRTGNDIPGRKEGKWEDYIDFMKVQLTELLTNYGEIGGIWLDGHWDQKEWDGKKFGNLKVDWHYDELYSLIHKLQPQALIGNNHHIGVIDGEDFQMFEKDLPGGNTTGWGTPENQIGNLPLEVCETINGSWGFNLKDRKHKSDKDLIHYLIKSAGYGSNFLLNVGPMPNGKIQPKHLSSLLRVGDWLDVYGETIYGSSKGPIPPNDSLVSTQKDGVVFLHLLEIIDDKLEITNFNGKVNSIKNFINKDKISFKVKKNTLVIDLQDIELDSISTVLVVETN
ncbi:MAG: alpha-L-fucosidase [Rhodothermaeota bacterium MED-G19]|nr:MAG: alpha-L-fucosidase [Rhodothermaeota bacterium MED-G19]